MLLTITTTHVPATDMGFLLEKHPDKVHEFELSSGRATVFYPEATPERCTVALLLEIDSIGLVRSGTARHSDPGMDQYVNDRPYVASSFLSVALGAAFRSALAGKSRHRPELADTPLALEARIAVLPCRGGEQLLLDLFAPLGYVAEVIRLPLDTQFPYCWSTDGLSGLKLAPFHLLSSEGVVHTHRNHEWHMTVLARLAAAEPELLLATPHRVVEMEDVSAVTAATDWWLELTAQGGEGMVVKPMDFVTRGADGLLQPALKCRGREYLRIIYGPDYDEPKNLERLRRRGLSVKRSLALKEFCLGVEALTRFVGMQPLRQVHECVFGVLALESEPVDPRL